MQSKLFIEIYGTFGLNGWWNSKSVKLQLNKGTIADPHYVIVYKSDEITLFSFSFIKHDEKYVIHGKYEKFEDSYYYSTFYSYGKEETDELTPAMQIHQDCGYVYHLWYKDGQIHRDKGPALTLHNKGRLVTEKYYINGKLHREDGPAYIEHYIGVDIDNSESWFHHGERFIPVLTKKAD